MSSHATPLAVGIGAILLGLFAIVLEPLRQYVPVETILYGFPMFSSILSFAPFVVDPSRNVTYIGSRLHKVEHFQNIFYAEDTSGRNRFAPPVPLNYPKGAIIDATQPGAWCPQGTGDILPFTSRVTNVSENCLSLRISRPYGTKRESKLPVMVWLHGGGHALGSAYDVLYTPDGIVQRAAEDGQPLIFVAINYRLGFFGFATSRALMEAGHTNAGLRDQRAALEWVRDNIHNFGGDPTRVTAIGQSVGASDISLHLTSFGGTRGVPFQQAVMLSGAPGLNFNTKSDFVANNTAAIATEVECVSEGEDAQSQKTLECLRNAPVELLTNLAVTAARTARPPFGEAFFYPTYENDFLVDRPSQSMRAGKFVRGIPVIASWVTNDGAWYPPLTTSTDKEVLASFGLWLFGLSESTKAKLLDLYPLEDFAGMVRPEYDGNISPQYYRAAELNRDIWFTCPIIDFAWQYVKKGGAPASQVRLGETNVTRFAPVYEQMGVPMWRVAHLSEIPYVLNVQHLGGGADNSGLQIEQAKLISRTISHFVTRGIPGETWPAAFQNATRSEMEKEFPDKLTLQLFGGPQKNTPVTIGGASKEKNSGAMEAQQWDKLLERCSFINSASVREETGV